MSTQNGLRKLYIIGASGHAKEIAWLTERINEVNPTWEIMGFIEDREELWGTKVYHYQVLGGHDIIEQQTDEIWAIVAIAGTRARRRAVSRITPFTHIRFATLIDPSVIMSDSNTIGEGTMICAGNIITTEITIGDHVIINRSCNIGHDSIVEDFVTFYPGVNVSGNVNIGTGTELGTGSAVIQGITITENVILGAGGVVVKSITEPGTYVGVPARKIG